MQSKKNQENSIYIVIIVLVAIILAESLFIIWHAAAAKKGETGQSGTTSDNDLVSELDLNVFTKACMFQKKRLDEGVEYLR